mmetsp:Transcript_40190/g.45944  ORF Transcript_40190/g.45944 Transcript_40190/m.45944 type:complete len:143 (+) Transcript_40190:166-594(+)
MTSSERELRDFLTSLLFYDLSKNTEDSYTGFSIKLAFFVKVEGKIYEYYTYCILQTDVNQAGRRRGDNKGEPARYKRRRVPSCLIFLSPYCQTNAEGILSSSHNRRELNSPEEEIFRRKRNLRKNERAEIWARRLGQNDHQI